MPTEFFRDEPARGPVFLCQFGLCKISKVVLSVRQMRVLRYFSYIRTGLKRRSCVNTPHNYHGERVNGSGPQIGEVCVAFLS